ncbi:GNAT family protein [Dinghuibacter silviterrae]|uniref:L-amino acid N-acyltransferase YncA n=1 Tax=Dinghuibacter silviterrae TaxID=1539049 RepID=A0A4R8DEK2_9BACT|nr:GNAT family N-acetyltransferase [Dinghuibacter silviterrae]TDW95817.1 L-amino acid N-acyltransferase YncA [Dinghuibacter silviterrae]
MLTAKIVTTEKELDQIAALSQANLVTLLDEETKAKEGFVTWVYTPEVLRILHAIVPSVIVMDGDTLAGYALTLTDACEAVYPVMGSTMAHLKTIGYEGRRLADYRIYLMGQICVAEPYRGQGVVERLYGFHRDHFSTQYDMLVTEISQANPRSLKAHKKVGFEVIDSYPDNGSTWDVVLWDWR